MIECQAKFFMIERTLFIVLLWVIQNYTKPFRDFIVTNPYFLTSTHKTKFTEIQKNELNY